MWRGLLKLGELHHDVKLRAYPFFFFLGFLNIKELRKNKGKQNRLTALQNSSLWCWECCSPTEIPWLLNAKLINDVDEWTTSSHSPPPPTEKLQAPLPPMAVKRELHPSCPLETSPGYPTAASALPVQESSCCWLPQRCFHIHMCASTSDRPPSWDRSHWCSNSRPSQELPASSSLLF